jgi:hypothetical protein
MTNTHSPLQWVTVIVVLAIIGYQLYSGFALKKIGVPGLFEVEFAEPTYTSDHKSKGSLDSFSKDHHQSLPQRQDNKLEKLLGAMQSPPATEDSELRELMEIEFRAVMEEELKKRNLDPKPVNELNIYQLEVLAREHGIIQ